VLARVAALVIALLLVAVACTSGGTEKPAVSAHVITESTAPALRVLAPVGKGPWPVVVALHGYGGTGRDMVELATRVARAGAVVFVPTYRTDLRTAQGLVRAGDDISCAYRTALRSARRYGGDLSRPVTVVGWSLGADLAVLGALGPRVDPGAGRCPGELRRPSVVVALSGCYFRFQGDPVTWFDNLAGWTNEGDHVHLVAGDRDATCAASQTDRLARSLRRHGYDVNVTRLRNATHGAPIFHEDRGGQWRVVPDDPAGGQAVELVVHAIDSA
jgi:dienelactone hydrolase